MRKEIKKWLLPILFFTYLVGMFFACVFISKQSYSSSERRELQQMPKLSWESVWDGSFMEQFDRYTLDQFPIREAFRGIKANAELGLFGKKTTNGYYVVNGSISKIDYPLNEQMLDHAINRFDYLYENYLEPNEIEPYIVMVPDKNYYLAKENGYLALDYEYLFDYVLAKASYMTNIDVTNLLCAEDYYQTDTHWRQEKIIDVADEIAQNMGTVISTDFKMNTLENPFYGVHYYQSALGAVPDEICYLSNEILDQCIVTYYDDGTAQIGDMYNMKKAAGNDAYEMFLSGSTPVATIENPNANNHKKLIIFRDSFGSSIAPLLASGYEKITVVDIRYVQSMYVGQFVDFSDSEVLFLYSTMLLNNSGALR